MSPVLELNLFIILMFLAVGGLVWFLVAREISSTRRMTCMMRALGLDYDLAKTSSANAEAIISLARARCLRCRSEGLCERWLGLGKKDERFIALLAEAPGEAAGAARKVAGEMGVVRAEDFCPNATSFRRLARVGAPQVEPHDAGATGSLNVH